MLNIFKVKQCIEIRQLKHSTLLLPAYQIVPADETTVFQVLQGLRQISRIDNISLLNELLTQQSNLLFSQRFHYAHIDFWLAEKR